MRKIDKAKEQPGQQVAINVNLDKTPIFYTENISIISSEDGVVLDFCQKLGATNQLQIVARVGMSKNHAKKFVNELGKLLALTQGSIETGKKN